ncbi:MAG TPA: FAD/NAD(P)-binding oxidoreductase [Solirubrobacterales bacterium]|jgi:sulfide:quinone oxidoreductase
MTRSGEETGQRCDVLIAGGGSAGIAVAARLARKMKGADIAVIEPSETHYYQPLWTLVGGGVFPKERSARPQSQVMPRGVRWIKDSVAAFEPEESLVRMEGGGTISYGQLVVAIGLTVDWDATPGLAEGIRSGVVVSNYSYDTCERTWEAIQGFEGGTALFTMPSTPIKCAGAPQKIMYLAEHAFRRQGVRDRAKVHYLSGTPGIFGVPYFAEPLNRVIAERSIETTYRHDLAEIRVEARQAVFDDLEGGEQLVLDFDLLHATPFQRSPQVVADSPLAGDGGWVAVDKHTLVHERFENVFSLGDCSSCPTSKTGAAVRKQAPVVVENMIAQRQGRSPQASYDGYASCPLVTGYGSLILAEFDYDKQPEPSFPLLDPRKERRSMYALKKWGLPPLYWNGMLKGRA